MREIEYRAWQKYHKKMLEVFSIRFADNETRRVVEIGTVSPQGAIPKYIYYHENSKDFRLFDENNEPILILMQYTGCKDKNGTKIFEGDILHWKDCSKNSDGSLESNVVVIWDDKNLRWGVKILDFAGRGNIEELSDYNNTDEIEVIGNIYENPKLLEVED